jgi:hypothetical protein
MTLEARISSKTRAGIAALTFAAVLVPFVLATPAKAIVIQFLDATETLQVTEDGVPVTTVTPEPPFFEEFVVTRSFTSFPSTVTPTFNPGPPARDTPGGIVFLEPGTDIISDILAVHIFALLPLVRSTFFVFESDPVLTGMFGTNTTGFTRIEEDGTLQEVGTAQIPFRNAAGAIVSLPFDIRVFVQSDVVEIPGPVVGAGLPGLVAACGVLLALARRRQRSG